jgi:uncharacterized membrane protein YdbT with pleckstrin-like domain
VDLHPGERVVFEGHPSWRALLAFYLAGAVAALAVAVVWALVGSAGAAVAVGLAIFAVVLVVGYLRRIGTRYLITTQRLTIRRGMLSRRVQQTRIERVQNVNTEQSFLERLMRVGTVDFDTAGSDDSEFRFVGVADPGAISAVVDHTQREALDADRSRGLGDRPGG